jgi:2-haloacid dehalogenase
VAARVRALLFDVFGTLVDWRTSVATQLDAFGRERGIACDWYAFVDAWRAEYPASMNAVRSGDRAWANLDGLQGESFDLLAKRFGLPAIAPDDRAWAVRRWHALEPWPEVPAALERLHEGYVTATLSNGGVELLVNLARHAKLRFDTIFSAETFRHYKPDPETYLGAAALLGCEPGETMLVAAHESDLRAAAANGLRTAFVRRPAEYGPSARAAQHPEGFDYAVDGLDALLDELRGASVV